MNDMTPRSLDDLEIQELNSPSGIMLREVVPDLNKRHFTFIPCPDEHIHYYALEEGEGNPERIGSWAVRCPGPIGPLLRNEDARPGERCRPQYGKKLPAELVLKLLFFREQFKKQYDVANALATQLKEVDRSLEIYYSLGPCPPLPQKAAALICGRIFSGPFPGVR